ncbi:hypothetical protein GP486_007584 [Trichoglossum hirsutum]|uniref:Uncharacterized protein n=1 Tax=Trichoglossum hirsutum TaxID=265104 RepID=A0A9P8L7K7_9PEZI|nr:hypothetical protein GP486_007584 [Trichoglossum hirsutum]
MGETRAFGGQSVRFNSELLPSPPNAPPPTFRPRTRASVLQSFLHAASLFHAYEYHQALKAYRRILRQEQDFVSESILWFNIGVLRDHLGEHALAGDAYERSVRLDGSFSLGWFSLGNTISLLGDFRRALKAFKICERTFLLGDSIDYSQQGLPWTLEKTRVIFNIRQTALRKLHKQHGGPLDQAWSLNRLPAGIIFGLGAGVIVEDEEPAAGTSTSSTTEPYTVETTEPWIRAGVGSPSSSSPPPPPPPLPPAKHDQPRKHATTRAGYPRGPSLPPIPSGKKCPDTAMPSQSKPLPFHPHREKQVFHNQQQQNPARLPNNNNDNNNNNNNNINNNSQSRTNAQVSTADVGHSSGSSTRDRPELELAPSTRLDSFGIFALGEGQLRMLRAEANKASSSSSSSNTNNNNNRNNHALTKVLGRSRSFRYVEQ